MKKALVVALGAAALALYGGPAFALTAAHMATATGATQGDCSKCHIPHKALGAERLFPIAIGTATQSTYGFMGTMCAEYCHNQVGTLPRAYAADTALQNPGATNVSNSAHGLNLKTTAMPPTTTVPTTLPYGDGNDGTNALGVDGNFECTTCHDPHKNAAGDTSQALLQMDIDALCDECHTARGTGDGTWGGYGAANDLGTNSSHPVGTNVTGDNSDPGNSTIDVGGSATVGSTPFDVAYGAAGDHNLGGHMINGGAANTAGVGCVTCHAVHGNQSDPGASQPPAPTGPYEDLLAVSQGTTAAAVEPDRSANGQGDAEDALCSGCHMQTVDTPATSWNPGGTPYSHPANGNAASVDWGAIVAPAGWPSGDPADVGTNLSVAVICETCHDPHGAAEQTHILRTAAGDLCNSCHSTSATGHHPVGAMSPFSDDSISGNDGNTANLTCGDCHAGSQGGAHNWGGAGGSGIGIASNWEPANNGRGANQAAEDFVINTSKECIDCHTNAGARNNPVDDARDAGSLEATGTGSHYLGASDNTKVDLAVGRRGDGTTVFNSTTATWTRGGWSRYGGSDATNYEIVCESCHELEPDKNGNVGRLLLEPYVEVEDVDFNALCVGCHGVIPGGTSVHPLTGQTVSKAVDARPGTPTLITATTGFANAAGSPNGAEYPATANRMTCDSCHQVHMADTAGGSYILETGSTGGTGLVSSTASGVAIGSHNAETNQGINHAALCTQCHNY